MSITESELTPSSSSRSRDVVDYEFEEMDEFIMDVEQSEHSEHSGRSSHTPSDGIVDDTLSDPDYDEEGTELHENDDSIEDDFDRIVTRGRARESSSKATKATKKDKKEKPKKTTPSTRQNRTTRAASVRF